MLVVVVVVVSTAAATTSAAAVAVAAAGTAITARESLVFRADLIFRGGGVFLLMFLWVTFVRICSKFLFFPICPWRFPFYPRV